MTNIIRMYRHVSKTKINSRKGFEHETEKKKAVGKAKIKMGVMQKEGSI
jgi:hypothetical protein